MTDIEKLKQEVLVERQAKLATQLQLLQVQFQSIQQQHQAVTAELASMEPKDNGKPVKPAPSKA